ncbi:MAG: enoyl-CoA hydratase-related protein [Alphaproteobacteria bacterium]|jgi:enoyl-CoA hydratase|nr:enoyl-CoA hydratase-related protein [Alphaproteobacteria bacterium]
MIDVLTIAPPEDGVLLLTLNRPRQRNALSGELIHAIAEALTAVADDDAIRCVVITGSGGVFSAGADIKEFIADGVDALDNAVRNTDWARIERFPKPLIAAVEGFAFGGGHELMLLADIIVAGDDARFGQPEIDIGVIPGDGGTQRVTRIAGKPLAMLMIMGGEPIDAQTALAAGLVSKLVPSGTASGEAMALAKTLAAKPPVALRMAKQAVLAAYETTLSAGTVLERQVVCRAFDTEDREEGMAAFKEKRDPNFKGK